MAKQKFKLVYVKDGALCGSYSGIPGEKDIVLITRAALEGLESPIPEGYIIPEGVLEITENGEVDIAEFKKVIINVAGQAPTGSIEITANGEHDVAGKATAVVNVPNPSTGILNIEANGEYNVTEKAGVNVTVPQPSGTIQITQNTFVDVKNYAYANVNVPVSSEPQEVDSSSVNFIQAIIGDASQSIGSWLDAADVYIDDSDIREPNTPDVIWSGASSAINIHYIAGGHGNVAGISDDFFVIGFAGLPESTTKYWDLTLTIAYNQYDGEYSTNELEQMWKDYFDNGSVKVYDINGHQVGVIYLDSISVECRSDS